MTATITWRENRRTGNGELVCRYDDGTEDVREYDGNPIKTGPTDSDHLASLFGPWDWVEQDGEFIHVGIN
jgi:hypothetical protein